MAYTSDNFELLVGHGPAGKQVFYGSGTDAIATVRAANFITDAKAKGMRVGDILIYADTTTPLVSLSRVTVVASTGATLVA